MWYVEIYLQGSQRPNGVRTNLDFATMMSGLEEFKAAKRSDIMRVLSPTSATVQQLRAIAAIGATLG